ncbi:EamA family transporter RarD [Teredinibacter purpureus]|uniref:EamA family transporter RarD n=1 Tax=Teredinibacter purpureus TaxID=2731756 RepID=UPI0005F7F6CA|nr:EamA family transporter RarD [Teredinibacter purpureus]
MHTETKQGLVCAISAYTCWGFVPLYFRQFDSISAGELLGHRIFWSALFVSILLLVLRRFHLLIPYFRSPRTLLILAAGAFCVALNWLVFIWATNNGYLLETSLGYYINPLVNIIFGLLFLGEKLRRAQWIAVLLATIGVSVPMVTMGSFPVIALTLAFSFGGYGLLRKLVRVNALEGLFIETLILLIPVTLYFIFLSPMASLQIAETDFSFALLLVAAGPITSIPLILFAGAVNRLNYSTVGFIQYLAPTIVLITAVGWLGEVLVWQKTLTFIFIWIALAIYSWDAWRVNKRYAPLR